MTYSPWFKVGGSLFGDEDFLRLDGLAQWGYLVLHGHALFQGGEFYRAGAIAWFRMVNADVDGEAVWEALVAAEMVRPLENSKWEVAGWAKHQSGWREDPSKKRERNAQRPTTTAGRKGEPPPVEPSPSVERLERSSTQPSGTGLEPAGTRSAPTRGHRPSLSLAAAAAAAAEQQQQNNHQEKREGGAGGNQDRDIQDLLHDLTGARPWKQGYGKAAVDLQQNYGRAEAEEALVAVHREDARRSPWELVRAAEVKLARDQSKRKEQEQAQARRDRAKPKEPEYITEEEHARINAAANYREPGDE